ncbi:MAG: ribosome silencing factor [Planctomycetota bacterium]|jgi:ribosome-associated protein
MELPPRELALHAARAMLDKGAEDLIVLHLNEEQRGLFEYVVIANGRSERQARTLADEVYHLCKRQGIPYFPPEGDAGWRVVDCHEVVAHAFTPELRAFYRLDELWADAERIDVEAELAALAPLDGKA